MKKTKTKSKKPAKSMLALAADLKVSRSTLYGWKAAGAPIDKGEAAVLEWAIKENRRGQDNDEMRTAKMGVLNQTERRLKLANDEKSKGILKREDVERESAKAMAIIWQALELSFGNELPPELAHRSAQEIASLLGVQFKKLTGILRLEFRRFFDSEKVPAGEYQAVKLSAEAVAVMAVLDGKAFHENVSHEWTTFLEWKKKDHAERAEGRREWCQKRAAAGLPVPDATDAELAAHPGLKRME